MNKLLFLWKQSPGFNWSSDWTLPKSETSPSKKWSLNGQPVQGWEMMIGSSCHSSIVTISTGMEVEGSSIFLGRQTDKWADTLLWAPVIHLSHHYWGAGKWHPVGPCHTVGNLTHLHSWEVREHFPIESLWFLWLRTDFMHFLYICFAIFFWATMSLFNWLAASNMMF